MMALRSLYDKDKRGRIQDQLRRGAILSNKPAPEPCITGNPSLFERALEGRDFTPLSAQDKQLLRAIFFGNHASADDALSKGANPNVRDASSAHSTLLGMDNPRLFGDTGLMMATKKGDIEMVRLLIKFKADVNLDFAYGSYPYPTALTYARSLGHHDIERELIAAGAVR